MIYEGTLASDIALRAEAASLDLGVLSSVELRRDEGEVVRGFAVLLIKRAPAGG